MTRAEFLDEIDELILARTEDAEKQRAEAAEGERRTSWAAIDAALRQDLAALRRVRSLTRQFMAEREKE